jgi:hypothetical protein
VSNSDDQFADLIASLDSDRIAVEAVAGAAHDLAADLEQALVDLHEQEPYAFGEEAERVDLEIRMAEFALRKLSRMFDLIAELDAARDDDKL